MKEFEHLMSVWQGQPKPDQLSVDEALKQVKKGIRSLTSKLYWGIVAMVALIVCAAIITFFFPFRSPSTTFGILIITITMLLYLSLIVRHYHILNKHDLTQNPTEYINTLKEYQRNRTKVTGWFYYIYMMLISAGLALYFIEVLENAPLYFKFITYGSTIVWFLFITLYLKPRMFKNEEEKLNLMIDRLLRLQEQFD
jgi:heme/copper-type cytochrome/quinol oxidase subunit 2